MKKGKHPKFRDVINHLPKNPGVEMLRYGWTKENVISLAQGEGSLSTPSFIADAAMQAMKEGKTFYGPVLGQPLLRQEIANYYARIFNLSLPTNQIFITGSGTTAMDLALSAILDEGDEVVSVMPIWKNLLGAVALAKARIKQVPLGIENNQWSLDLDQLSDACTSRTRAILLVSPSNPTGWVISEEEIKSIMDFARDREIWIIADEVYNRILYNGQKHAPSFLSYAKPEDQLFTINSFSKAWAMTGWRLGWLTGPNDAEEKVRDIALYNNMCPCTFSQFGAIAALRHGEDFIAEQITQWAKNREIIEEFFAKRPHCTLPEIEATFYAFFKVEGFDDCMVLSKKLIDEAGLSLAPGCSFGQNSKGYLRLCFAVSEERLQNALERLASVIDKCH